MMQLAPRSSLVPDYDAFLFAPIGEDGNGMPLSVLSALARQDVDPWQEAAQLAQLPGSLAAKRLRLRIEALPSRSVVTVDPTLLATRLLKLLPGATIFPRPKRLDLNSLIIAYLMVAALIMSSEYMLARHSAPTDRLATSPPPSVPDHIQADKPKQTP